MPDSDWRSHIAVAGGVIAGFLLALWISHVAALGPAPGKIGTKPKAQDGQSEQSRTKPKQDQRQTAEDEAYCKDSKERSDCLIQLRTARATEAQARYAMYGLWLVGATIALTAIASMAAIGSAIFGAKSVRMSALAVQEMAREVDIQIRAERPLLFLARIDGLLKDPHWINFSVQNAGKTPAVLVEWCATCKVMRDLPKTPTYGHVFTEGAVISSTESTPLTTPADNENGGGLAEVFNGTIPAYLWGYLLYEDVFGRRRKTGFGYVGRVSPLAAMLIGNRSPTRIPWYRTGSNDAYNYDREVG